MPAASHGRDGGQRRYDPTTIAIGTVGKPHGVRGEIALRLFNDELSEDLLEGLDELIFERDGARQVLAVVEVRPGPHGLLISLAGVETREQAAALTLSEVRVQRDRLPGLQDDEYYVSDVVGCDVFTEDGTRLGTIAETFWNGAQDVMVVRGDGSPPAEHMIPMVPAFVRQVDAVGRKVRVAWDV